MVGFQVMPPLTTDERAELEESIRVNGVQVPILVTADGTIVDGHHRDEIARKHNLHCPRTVSDKSETELRGLAFSLNLHRRHLTREQKRAVVAESIKADPQLSDREHGRRTGVSDKTAGSVRRDLEESAEVPHFSERIDPRTGNASQPAIKPKPTFTCWSCEESFPVEQQTETDDGPICGDCLDVYDRFAVADTSAPVTVADVDLTPEPATPPAQQKPAKPRRRPLEEGFFDATMRLGKAVTSLKNLGNDDRLPRNKEQVVRYRNDLLRAIDALQRVADQLA